MTRAAVAAGADPPVKTSALVRALASVAATALAMLTVAALSARAELPQDDAGLRETLDVSRTGLELNSAAFAELCSLPGISPAVAAAIIDRRRKQGCLRALDDLLGAGGLTEPELAAIRPYVTVEGGCRGAGARLSATAALWAGGGRAKGVWSRAAELRLDAGSLRLRLKHRRGYTGLHGGGVVRGRGAVLAIGDILCVDGPALAFSPGSGLLTFDGPLPREPSTGAWGGSTAGRRGGVPAAGRGGLHSSASSASAGLTPTPARGGAVAARAGSGVTTTSGERFRGVALALERGAVAAAGVMIDPWGRESGPAGLLSVPVLEGRAYLVRCASAVWGKGPSGAAYLSAAWRNKPYLGCAEAALRRAGGAWLAALSAAPGRDGRVAVVIAGRWGRYFNPLGPGEFRSDGAPRIIWRMRCSARLRYVGSLTTEQLVRAGGGDARYLKRSVRLRTRLQRGLWSECEVRGEVRGEGGGARRREGQDTRTRVGLKLIWRPSSRTRVEVLIKVLGEPGARSSLRGWRASTGRGAYAVEAGGFYFDAERSLYFYEREIVGLSSLKALKGEGAGWYLCVRVEPPGGFGPMSFMGGLELKIRTVVGEDGRPGGTFIGVQLGRR